MSLVYWQCCMRETAFWWHYPSNNVANDCDCLKIANYVFFFPRVIQAGHYYVRIERFMPRVDIVHKHNAAARRLYIRGHNGKVCLFNIYIDSLKVYLSCPPHTSCVVWVGKKGGHNTTTVIIIVIDKSPVHSEKQNNWRSHERVLK